MSSGWIIVSALLPRASLTLAVYWSTLRVSSHVCIRALPENFLPLIYPPCCFFFPFKILTKWPGHLSLLISPYLTSVCSSFHTR